MALDKIVIRFVYSAISANVRDMQIHLAVAPQMSFFNPALPLHRQLPEDFPSCWRRATYNVFRRYFGINTRWYVHSHLVWLRLSLLFNKKSPCRVTSSCSRLGDFSSFPPQLSNIWSPPAELWVYLREISLAIFAAMSHNAKRMGMRSQTFVHLLDQ